LRPFAIAVMTSTQIRQSFLDFFKSKQHTIVPSSSLMPDSPNLLFTNAGMNQFVPIFLGQTQCPYSPGRAADTQKCIRAGGKHNDLDDVGLDTYHHTFFEMLGNWSFGNYFKAEAITWAWELVVETWKFPPERLYATVYNPDKSKHDPSEFDQEAWNFWAGKFRSVGLDPAVHIVNGNKKDNFWMMGETGPCGPCSELHVDLTPDGQTAGKLVNKGDPRCIEIWNLVFIQFNANPDGTFSPLPAKHVDTGMGFERVTSIIQGTNGLKDFANARISNYETDIFRPIFDAVEKLSGKKYGSTLPNPGSTGDSPVPVGDPPTGTGSVSAAQADSVAATSFRGTGNLPVPLGDPPRGAGSDRSLPTNSQIQIDIAFRVIADHIRTLSFAIADGIQPGNNDRNYVLRRILRRAVRYGRTLGFKEPFFYKLVDVLADTMGDVFPEIRARKKQVQETIRIEEEAFNKTLDKGISLFNKAVQANTGRISTSETREQGIEDSLIKVFDKSRSAPGERPPLAKEFAFELYDTYGFPLDLTELMARERGLTVDTEGFEKLMEEQRARARAAQKKTVITVQEGTDLVAATEFLGYEQTKIPSRVLKVIPQENRWGVVLAESPFYAEMGGQVGDTGIISLGAEVWRVVDTKKVHATWLHIIEGDKPPAIGPVDFAEVDRARRLAIERHHTVTHLLHWALHEVASKEASQKGSFVGPDKLTFDFNSAPLTPQQVTDIEKLVNERILENAPVSWTEVPHAEVKNRQDVMQFFGDKYGDVVRVVQIGGKPAALDGYSMEFCGGTHTRATGEIGLFRIVGENAIAAGVRRIEAVAGLEAYGVAHSQLQLIRSLAGRINSPVHELEKKVDLLLAQQKELEKSLKSAIQRNAAQTASWLVTRAHEVNEIPLITQIFPDSNADYLQAVADALKGRFKGVVVVGGSEGGSVALVASVSPEFTAKVQAGKLIQQIAPIVGGKGGGKPDNARGGGKDPARLDEALARVKSLLA
jgi:alanyl-tRNA synthetase